MPFQSRREALMETMGLSADFLQLMFSLAGRPTVSQDQVEKKPGLWGIGRVDEAIYRALTTQLTDNERIQLEKLYDAIPPTENDPIARIFKKWAWDGFRLVITSLPVEKSEKKKKEVTGEGKEKKTTETTETVVNDHRLKALQDIARVVETQGTDAAIRQLADGNLITPENPLRDMLMNWGRGIMELPKALRSQSAKELREKIQAISKEPVKSYREWSQESTWSIVRRSPLFWIAVVLIIILIAQFTPNEIDLPPWMGWALITTGVVGSGIGLGLKQRRAKKKQVTTGKAIIPYNDQQP